MDKDYLRNQFEIEREIYHTQWKNIRHHWDETSKGVRYLATLVLLGIFPLKFLIAPKNVIFTDFDHVSFLYLKIFIVVIILFMGLITFLNQLNHYRRSQEARKVVVKIEEAWCLYDQNGKFKFQDLNTDFAYSKFAGGEKRITYSIIQFAYTVIITSVGIGFVVFT